MTPAPGQMSSIVDLLRWRTDIEGSSVAYRFLADGETESESITWRELDRRARSIAAALQQRVSPGDRVLLAYPSGIDFIVAFFGCLYAGAIAVPAPLPTQRRAWPRFAALAEDADARLALGNSGTPHLGDRMTWLVLDELPAPDSWREHHPASDDVAFLQYTSGSTSSPRGVIVTHANLLHNERMIRSAFAQDEHSIVAGWLPMHHDMGLIGNVLQPLYSGGTCILMPPAAFLQRPVTWLRTISRYRATTSGGPDFAYALCARRVRDEEKESLDLSSWRVAFNGSEPVRHDTIERFTAAFERCGFRREAFHPCYGLAEATLMVTSKRAGAAPVARVIDERMRVSSGRVADGQHVVIDGGEICVAGPSVASGYWRRPDETEAVFGGGLLRTGDLGFVDDDGELFVTGRIKELIIIRGRNHYPHDIEKTAEEAVPALVAGGGAAFSVEIEGTERLVIVHEVDRHALRADLAPVIDAVRGAVAETHDIQPHAVVLIRPGMLPRTTSGKVQRRACAQAFLDGTLESVAADVLDVTRMLGLDATDASRSVVALGLDSLRVIELRDAIERETGVVLSLEEMFGSTVGDLAAILECGGKSRRLESGSSAAALQTLSDGQRSLWFMHRLAPDSAAYHVSFALRADASLDVEKLRRAFDALVARHDMLRSRFPMGDGHPVRVNGDPPRLELFLRDPRLEEEAHRPFDIERDALVRFHLYRTTDGSQVLLFVAHHILVDFWSLVVLVDELRQLYGGAELPPLTATYADFVQWQRALPETSLERWRERLAGEIPPLVLPADEPRPPVQTYRGASHHFTIDAETTRALRERMRADEATLFVGLLTAWMILLSRYSGQEDIVVGAPAAGRSRADFANVVGYFANLLPIRATIRAELSFRELLAEVKARVVEALALQDVPFPRIVERVAPRRDPSRSPLVQVAFALEKPHKLAQEGIAALALGRGGSRIALGDLELESVELRRHASQFDVTLMIVESGEVLEAALEYNANLFAPQTIARMARHFTNLLRSSTLMDEDERLLLESWNATERDYPCESTLGELFDEQVALRPEAIAVEMGEERLTYRELSGRADELAARLRGASRVGIRIERSIEHVVAMLAAIKAGAAYVPLDSAYPEERLNFMIADAGVDVILECGGKATAFQSGGNAAALQTAYVMYTSGSTGKPKGVLVPHRAIVRLVKNQTYASFGPEETLLHFAPATFDAATFEIWGALLNGARLVIQPQGRASLDDLAETIERHGVTTLWLTAGLFHAMVDERITAFRGIRQLLAGGDVLSAAHVKKVLEAFPGITVINGYGPTEATTFTCCHRVTDPESIGATLPIGRPIANTKVYVLDRAQQPVPIGVPGELWIGGDGLAIGYTNGERFDGLYRTGDRVRWNAKGEIEFLGRFDDQLKIRGFRIEPAEIETALREHPDVADAVVVARDKTLVAYVTGKTEELRDHLRSRLPDHMIPSRIIALDAFPLTANGKVDRRALPVPELTRDSHTPPRTDVERLLASLWRDALRVESVGIHDNFFDLGAHSLLIAQVQARLGRELQWDVPIVDFFTYPSIASLAGHIAKSSGGDDFQNVRARAAARRQAMAARKRSREPQEDLVQ